MRETESEAKSTVIMFGLGLPAGSFPLRSQQECKECCMRRKKEGAEERGRNRGEWERKIKQKKEKEGGQQGSQGKVKIGGGRLDDEGRG